MAKKLMATLLSLALAGAMIPANVMAEEGEADIVSYNADTKAIYLEVDKADIMEADFAEKSLAGVKLYDKVGNEITEKTVSMQDNYVVIKPTDGLSTNERYIVEVKGLKTTDGILVSDYRQPFKVMEFYSETFDTADAVSKWNTQGVGSWVENDGNGQMKFTHVGSGDKQYIFSSLCNSGDNVEYVTDFDFYVYDNDSDSTNALTFNEFMFYSNKPHNNAYNQGAKSINYSIGRSRNLVIDNYDNNNGYKRTVFYNAAKSSNLTVEAGVKHNVRTVNKNGTGFMYVDGILEAKYDYSAIGTVGKGGLGFLLGSNTVVGIDNIRCTYVTECEDLPKNVDIASYNADTKAVYLEIDKVGLGNATIIEEALEGVKLYDKYEIEVESSVSLQGNYIVIKPVDGLVTNQKYAVEANGVMLDNGAAVNDYRQAFKVMEFYSETFDNADAVSKWNTQGVGSWVENNGDGQMKFTHVGSGDKQYIFSSAFTASDDVEYVTDFDFYVYDNDSDSTNALTFNEFMFYSNKPHNKAYNQGNESINYSIGRSRNLIIDNYKNYGRTIFYNAAKSSNLTIEVGDKHNVRTVNKNGTGFMYVDGILEATYDYSAIGTLSKGCLGFLLGSNTVVGLDNIICTYVAECEDVIEEIVVPQKIDITSYNADTKAVYLEIGDIDAATNPITTLGNIKLYDKNGNEVVSTVSVQGNYILVKPEAGLSVNQKYTVEAEGIVAKDGTGVNAYRQGFKVIKIYAETFDNEDAVGKWSTGGLGSWVNDNGNGIMKITKTNGGENGYIFSSEFRETSDPEYVTELDFYVYDNDDDPTNSLVFNEFMFYSNKPHNQNYNQGNASINYSIGKSRNLVIDNHKDYGRTVFYNEAKSSNLTIEAGVKHTVRAVNKNGTGFFYVDGILEATYDYSSRAPLGSGCFGIYVGGNYGGTVVGVDNIMCTYVVDCDDEEDEGEEAVIAITEATVSAPSENGEVTANVTVQNNSYAGTEYVVAVAVYDENHRLIGIKTAVENQATQGTSKEYNDMVIENAGAMAYAKVFLWDGIETMNPIGTMREISETTNITLYVNPSADLVSADGSCENPYPTIDMAIERIESEVNSGAFNVNFTVDVAEGDIYLEDTVKINDYKGKLATSGAKITIEGQGTDKTFVKSGKKIENSDIYKVEDNGILSRVPSGARNNIYAIDLVENGYVAEGESLELAVNGKVQTVAKYPNKGYLVTGDVTSNGMGFKCSDSRVSAWETADDMYVYYMPNYFSYAYKVTAKNGVIETANNAGFSTEKNYYVYNLLEELDCSGEYYYDKANGVLYLYSENGVNGKYEIYNMKNSLFSLEYCSNVSIENMTLENNGEKLVTFKNAKNSCLEDCVLRNGTKSAVQISGGKNSGLSNCEIYDMGTGGVTLSGGNRDVLSKARNYVDRCSIHDCQRIDRSYNALVSMSGVGNYVTNSDIYNAYHQAITIYGNDLEIKNNKIYNVCTETTDMGAIYAEGDWTLRGTVIEHNYFADIPAVDSMGPFAIYLDNGLSGITVKNNIFKSIKEQAVFVNGGRDNLITNNIFVDCGELGAISDILTWGSGYSYNNPAPASTSMLNKLNKVAYNEEPYTKYENLANILEDKPTVPKYNKFTGNVTVNTSGLSSSWLKNVKLYTLLWSAGCESSSKRCSTSDLTNYKGGDYTLSKSKADSLGFEWFDNSFGR